MKRQTYRLLLVLALVFAGPVHGGGSAEIPDVIHGDPEFYDAPVWVSAEAAETSDHSVTWDLLGEKAHRAYRYQSETQARLRELYGDKVAPGEGQFCSDPAAVRYDEVHVDLRHPPTLSDLDLYLSQQTSRVVLARVVDTAPGFFEGIPGTLLALEPQRTYKGGGDDSVFFVHYPVARFEIGAVAFCKQHEGLPGGIEVGDEVLFFAHDGPLPTEQTLFASWHGEIAVFSGAGETKYLPEFLHGKLGLSKEPQGGARAAMVLDGLADWFEANRPPKSEVSP